MITLQAITENIGNTWTLFDHLSIKFFMRLGIDILSVFILIRFIYFPTYKTKEYFFTFFILNIIIFLVTYLMNKSDMSMGVAFGLFAVFGILRFRTEDISIKDMTYLFLVIAIGMINAISKGGWDELSLINIIILIFPYLLETNILMKKEEGKVIQYENIEMIKPENHEKLIEDLKNRTGLEVHRFSITKVDFLRDTATIRIYYYEKKK